MDLRWLCRYVTHRDQPNHIKRSILHAELEVKHLLLLGKSVELSREHIAALAGICLYLQERRHGVERGIFLAKSAVDVVVAFGEDVGVAGDGAAGGDVPWCLYVC